jgi:hypothetical protein
MGTFQPEVPMPLLAPRIVEGGKATGIWINGSQVGALVEIAGCAGPCKICKRCCATMFFGDYMIGMTWEDSIFLTLQAVLATATRLAA